MNTLTAVLLVGFAALASTLLEDSQNKTCHTGLSIGCREGVRVVLSYESELFSDEVAVTCMDNNTVEDAKDSLRSLCLDHNGTDITCHTVAPEEVCCKCLEDSQNKTCHIGLSIGCPDGVRVVLSYDTWFSSNEVSVTCSTLAVQCVVTQLAKDRSAAVVQ
ncbi:uncharacterized protein LOC142588886 [Dermacentor variabilis]|uniref:uncharacterized protein LOC142588886 n=1 Tax=Dermacentor variabilis TaxID=34621 RepID=UPI003F5B9B9A